MTPEITIWQAAFSLLKQHGQNAESVAVQQVDESAEREDHEGRVMWTLIHSAVFELEVMSTAPAH